MDINQGIKKHDFPTQASLYVNNIGGIDETEVSLHQGVTVLSGQNATNRTSLLQGIMASLGSDQASLKADAEEGEAVLTFGDETYRGMLRRQAGSVVTEGDTYLEDPELADLFAFLLESNKARRAVARGDDLRDLIMRPVDTESIQGRIQELEQRKQRVDSKLENLSELEEKLPSLETKRTQLTDEIESLQEDLELAEEELESTNADVETRRKEQSKLEEKLDELRDIRSNFERTGNQIETERESIKALEEEREEVESQLEDLSPGTKADVNQLEAEIDVLQDEKAELDDEISQLQRTIQFNEQLLENPGEFLASDEQSNEGPVTDQLLPDADSETVTCWTCGSSVATEQIQTTIEQLQTVYQNRLEDRSEINEELDEKRTTINQINDNQTEYQRATRRLESIEDEIENRRERIDDLMSDRDALSNEVDALEDEVDDLESESSEKILEQHREVNQLEFKLERKEQERDNVEDEIASIEERLTGREELQSQREEVTEELTDLRTRIEQIEKNAVEGFNNHMMNILETLEYKNLERIWIDRTTRDVREGRRKVTKSLFDLKIVRSTEEGAAYEDSIDHLSESEREVTGLVFALAGYLVHDVYETVPFMLLDSLEAIDATRIAALVEYFESYVPYLIVALLEEDAQAIEGDHAVVQRFSDS